MRWFAAVGFLLLAVSAALVALSGACEAGAAVVWHPDRWHPDRWHPGLASRIWRPSAVEAGWLSLALAGCVFAGLATRGRSSAAVVLTASERWGGVLSFGLFTSTLLVGAALAFVFVAADFGAGAELLGAVFIAGCLQALVALCLAVPLLFLPKSRVAFVTLVVVGVIESGTLAMLWALGSGQVL